MITITFNQDVRTFKAGTVITLDMTKSICLCGDNGTGKSTILQLLAWASIIQTLHIEDQGKSEALAQFGEDLRTVRQIAHDYPYIGDRTQMETALLKHQVTVDLDGYSFNFFSVDNADKRTSAFDFGDIANGPSGEALLDHLYHTKCSNGESKVSQFFEFTQHYPASKSMKQWLLLDEPDSNASLTSVYLLDDYIPKDGLAILACHSPVMIRQYDNVLYFSKKNGWSTVKSMTGATALRAMRSRAAYMIKKRRQIQGTH